jgi:hypothetical protein
MPLDTGPSPEIQTVQKQGRLTWHGAAMLEHLEAQQRRAPLTGFRRLMYDFLVAQRNDGPIPDRDSRTFYAFTNEFGS